MLYSTSTESTESLSSVQITVNGGKAWFELQFHNYRHRVHHRDGRDPSYFLQSTYWHSYTTGRVKTACESWRDGCTCSFSASWGGLRNWISISLGSISTPLRLGYGIRPRHMKWLSVNVVKLLVIKSVVYSISFLRWISETNNKMLLWQQCGHWNVTRSKVKKKKPACFITQWKVKFSPS